jgi:hypothetical protein
MICGVIRRHGLAPNLICFPLRFGNVEAYPRGKVRYLSGNT